MAERGHLPYVDHRGFHVVLPSETWCTVMVHLGTTAHNLHMLSKTALLLLPPVDLAAFSRTYVDVVLGLMDVVLDGLVSGIPPLAFGGCISSCVTASFPSFWPGTASFTLLPFDATGKSSPRWTLALAQEAVRGKLSLRPFLFPCSILASQFCVFFCLQDTQLVTKNIDCEQYTHIYSTYRACTQHNHISSREYACLKDCASLCPFNNCHSRVMSHLPLFASSPLFSLTSQTPTTLLEPDEHLGLDERPHCDGLRNDTHMYIL